jgi:hypothetical protein
MKQFAILFVLAMALIGSAVADTTFPGTVTASNIVATTGTIGGVALSSGTMAYDFTITANHYFLQSGSGTFGTGTGAFTHNGPVGIASGIDITAAGGASDIDYALSSGFMTTPSGTNTLSGHAVFAKTVTVSEAAGSNASPTLTSSDTKTVYPVDASPGDATVTLPAASLVTGRIYMIASSVDPGSYYVRVKATSGKLGGDGGVAAATGLKCTDAACGITLVSDGTNYLITGAYGTWASG